MMVFQTQEDNNMTDTGLISVPDNAKASNTFSNGQAQVTAEYPFC